MRLPIELIAILSLVIVFFIWLIYLFISKWWLKYRYNATVNKSIPDDVWLGKYHRDNFGINNDKSRRNGEDTSRANPPTPESAGIVPEPSEVTERSSIPDVLAGKIRQDSSRLRNLLRRTKAEE